MIRRIRIRIPGRLAAATGLLVLAAAPAPAFAGFVTGGTMTLTLTAHSASALSHGRVLTYPVGPVTVKGSSTATGDRKSHVAIVKTSSFAVGLPVGGGSVFPGSAFVSTDGGLGFASIVHGQAVFVSQFAAQVSQSFPSVLLATFGTFDYGSGVFARLDTSHATFTTTPTGTTITGLKATLVASSARALNQALGTSAFSTGAVFAGVKIQTRET